MYRSAWRGYEARRQNNIQRQHPRLSRDILIGEIAGSSARKALSLPGILVLRCNIRLNTRSNHILSRKSALRILKGIVNNDRIAAGA